MAGYFYNELNCILCDTTSYEPPEPHDDDGLIWERLYDAFKCLPCLWDESICETCWCNIHDWCKWTHRVGSRVPYADSWGLFEGSQCHLHFIIIFLDSLLKHMWASLDRKAGHTAYNIDQTTNCCEVSHISELEAYFLNMTSVKNEAVRLSNSNWGLAPWLRQESTNILYKEISSLCCVLASSLTCQR